VADDDPEYPVQAFAAVSVGVLLMGLFHAQIGAFGKHPEPQAASSPPRR
jgi:hypothetical protein